MKGSAARAQKLLSERGVASRRHAEELIAAGRVTSRGRRITIGEKSLRTTALYQTDAFSSIVTSGIPAKSFSAGSPPFSDCCLNSLTALSWSSRISFA